MEKKKQTQFKKTFSRAEVEEYVKQMLSNANSKKNREEKDKVLESIQEKHGFSTEEMTYLKSLPMKDLVELMNEGTKEDK